MVDALCLQDLRGHKWHVQTSCATTSEGVYEGLFELANMVKDFRRMKKAGYLSWTKWNWLIECRNRPDLTVLIAVVLLFVQLCKYVWISTSFMLFAYVVNRCCLSKMELWGMCRSPSYVRYIRFLVDRIKSSPLRFFWRGDRSRSTWDKERKQKRSCSPLLTHFRVARGFSFSISLIFTYI